MNKTKIIEYFTEHISVKSSEIADYLGLKSFRTRDYLKEMIADEIVVAEGRNKNRAYKLKM